MPIKPVIVILDAAKLEKVLYTGTNALIPKAIRIERAEEYISASNTVALPIVSHKNASASFQDGRHRTIALTKRGQTTIPCLTAEPMKDALLAEFGASKQEALANYDFTACSLYPIYCLK